MTVYSGVFHEVFILDSKNIGSLEERLKASLQASEKDNTLCRL